MKIAFIGNGSFGTTMLIVLANALLKRNENSSIFTLVRRSELYDHFQNYRYHPDYKELRTVYIPSNVIFSNDTLEVMKDANYVIIAVPSKYIVDTLLNIKPTINSSSKYLSLTKGFVLRENENRFLRISEIISNTLEIESKSICSLGGPNTYKEIVCNFDSNLPNYDACNAVFSSSSIETAKEFQNMFYYPDILRTYCSTSIISGEICGALKNVYAIAVGIGEGFGMGNNFKASLITRSMFELSSFVSYFGEDLLNPYGLSGLGDLLATSLAGRSKKAGKLIAEGYSEEDVKKILAPNEIEGFQTLKVIHSWLLGLDTNEKNNYDMPILEAAYSIIYNNIGIKKAITDVLNRTLKAEFRNSR